MVVLLMQDFFDQFIKSAIFQTTCVLLTKWVCVNFRSRSKCDVGKAGESDPFLLCVGAPSGLYLNRQTPYANRHCHLGQGAD